MPDSLTMPPPEGVETELDAVEDEPEPEVHHAERRVYLVIAPKAGDRARVIDLEDGGEVTFGRSGDSAAVAIDDSRVSRRHARIFRSGADLCVEDLGSRNGTRVGGVVLRAAKRRVGGGDVVRIGPAEIVVATSTTRAPAASAAPAHDDHEVDRSPGVVVADPEMRKVFHVARRLARTQTTVLIVGETGAGKEVVAEEIHRASARARAPFVRLSCASLPETLLESELFGHEKGAFTGAERRRIGFFEAAHGGTLLLDEVGEMSAHTQAKLLLVLENRVVVRIGGTQEIPIDVRVICATHRDLEAEVAAGRFREDLYYRISAFTLRVPPLRERPAEIALLADVFARELGSRMQSPAPVVSAEAHAVLAAHAWPGNVRELRNAIEHAVVLVEDGVVRAEHLPASVRGAGAGAAAYGALRSEVASVERRNIEAALAAEGGNQTRAAVRLGISRRALIYKMEKYRIGR